MHGRIVQLFESSILISDTTTEYVHGHLVQCVIGTESDLIPGEFDVIGPMK